MLANNNATVSNKKAVFGIQLENTIQYTPINLEYNQMDKIFEIKEKYDI